MTIEAEMNGLGALQSLVERLERNAPYELAEVCYSLASSVRDAHLQQIATLYGLSEEVDPGVVEIRETADGCVVALAEETARWLYRYLDDGGWGATQTENPRMLRVGLEGDGSGRAVDDKQRSLLLRQPNVFERPIGATGPRLAHLAPGIYRRSNANRLDMLVVYVPGSVEIGHYHFGNLSVEAQDMVFVDALNQWACL